MNASAKFFEASAPVAFVGQDADNAPGFRWYDKDRLVHGRRLEDHLRFAVCYWHSLCWPGGDPFGGAGPPQSNDRCWGDGRFEFDCRGQQSAPSGFGELIRSGSAN